MVAADGLIVQLGNHIPKLKLVCAMASKFVLAPLRLKQAPHVLRLEGKSRKQLAKMDLLTALTPTALPVSEDGAHVRNQQLLLSERQTDTEMDDADEDADAAEYGAAEGDGEMEVEEDLEATDEDEESVVEDSDDEGEEEEESDIELDVSDAETDMEVDVEKILYQWRCNGPRQNPRKRWSFLDDWSTLWSRIQ